MAAASAAPTIQKDAGPHDAAQSRVNSRQFAVLDNSARGSDSVVTSGNLPPRSSAFQPCVMAAFRGLPLLRIAAVPQPVR